VRWIARLLLPLVLAVSACTDQPRGPVTLAVRDSAGVRVAENPAHAPGAGTAWSVEPAPLVDIGGGGGAASGLHRVMAAARLANGQIVVASAGTHQLRLFDGAGRHLRTVGRRGEGPGEFDELAWAGALRGDSIGAWDAGSKRLSVFDPQGTFVRAVTFHDVRGFFPQVHGSFADGSLVASSGVEPGEALAAGGAWRDTAVFLRLAPDGASMDTLGRFPGTEQFVVAPPGGRGAILVETLPFGRRTVVAVSGERFHVGTGDRYEVAAFDRSGQLRELTRRAHRPLSVTRRDVDDYRRGLVTIGPASSGDQRAQDELFATAPIPGRMPPYAVLLADPLGNLWVQETRRPGEWGAAAEWSVFDRGGGLVATVRTPAGLTVRQVGPDWILGTVRDADDVEHVRLHRLARR
jgi:hypothetical protein